MKQALVSSMDDASRSHTCFLGLTNGHADACNGHREGGNSSRGDHSWNGDHRRLGEGHLGRLPCLGLNLALRGHPRLLQEIQQRLKQPCPAQPSRWESCKLKWKEGDVYQSGHLQVGDGGAGQNSSGSGCSHSCQLWIRLCSLRGLHLCGRLSPCDLLILCCCGCYSCSDLLLLLLLLKLQLMFVHL